MDNPVVAIETWTEWGVERGIWDGWNYTNRRVAPMRNRAEAEQVAEEWVAYTQDPVAVSRMVQASAWPRWLWVKTMSEPRSYLYHPSNIISEVRTGDEHSWADEFRFLWTHDRSKMLALLDSVLTEGIREPVVIGEDGRLHDGHHRMAVAIALQLGPIEVFDHRNTEEAS